MRIKDGLKSKEPYWVSAFAILFVFGLLFTVGKLHLRSQEKAERLAVLSGLAQLQRHTLKQTNDTGRIEQVFDWIEITRESGRCLPSFVTPEHILVRTQNVTQGSTQLILAVDFQSYPQAIFGNGLRSLSKEEIAQIYREPGIVRADRIGRQ
jgi:hypothetical protein